MQRFHSLTQAVLAGAVLLLAMAHFRNQSYPPVIVLDPRDGHTEVARALRGDDELTLLFKAGFLEAVRMVTASWPYPVMLQEHRIAHDLAIQFFQPDLVRLVQDARALYGVSSHQGVPKIAVDFEEITIVARDGGFFFDAHVTQTLPIGGHDQLRMLHVQALGFLCPVTADNPTNIRFSKFRITEIQPQKEIAP